MSPHTLYCTKKICFSEFVGRMWFTLGLNLPIVMMCTRVLNPASHTGRERGCQHCRARSATLSTAHLLPRLGSADTDLLFHSLIWQRFLFSHCHNWNSVPALLILFTRLLSSFVPFCEDEAAHNRDSVL